MFLKRNLQSLRRRFVNKEIITYIWQYLDANRNRGGTTREGITRILTEDNDLEITPDLLRLISTEFGSRLFDSYLPPPALTAFVAEIAAMRTPKSIIDPTCGSGLMLKVVADRVQASTIHGIDVNIEAASVAERLLGDGTMVFRGDCLDNSFALLETYDLVVSEPPFGMLYNRPTSIEGVDGAKTCSLMKSVF
jgi:predicted RNA methylase